jgi:hypothetical protein
MAQQPPWFGGFADPFDGILRRYNAKIIYTVIVDLI